MPAADPTSIGSPIASLSSGAISIARDADGHAIVWLRTGAKSPVLALAQRVREKLADKTVSRALAPIAHIGEDGVGYALPASANAKSLATVIMGDVAANDRTRLMNRVVKALVACHSVGVIHGEVRPEAFIIISGDNGTDVVAVGYGLVGGSTPDQLFKLAARTGAAEALAYVSPERQTDARTGSPQDDMYALGVTCAQVAAGKPAAESLKQAPGMPPWVRALLGPAADRPKGRALMEAVGGKMTAIVARSDVGSSARAAAVAAGANGGAAKPAADQAGSQTSVSLRAASAASKPPDAQVDSGTSVSLQAQPAGKQPAGKQLDEQADSDTSVSLQAQAAAKPPADPAPRPPQAKRKLPRLRVTDGPAKGRTHDLTGPAVIGRSPTVDFTIADKLASRSHVRVAPEAGGKFSLTDLGSAAGVMLYRGGDGTGLRVDGTVGLTPGDMFLVGGSTMTLEIAETTAPATAAPASIAKGSGAAPSARVVATSSATVPAPAAKSPLSSEQEQSGTAEGLDIPDVAIRPKPDIGEGPKDAGPLDAGADEPKPKDKKQKDLGPVREPVMSADGVELRGQKGILRTPGSRRKGVELGMFTEDVGSMSMGVRALLVGGIILAAGVLALATYALSGGFAEPEKPQPSNTTFFKPSNPYHPDNDGESNGGAD